MPSLLLLVTTPRQDLFYLPVLHFFKKKSSSFSLQVVGTTVPTSTVFHISEISKKI
jgi:hypothetical protein